MYGVSFSRIYLGTQVGNNLENYIPRYILILKIHVHNCKTCKNCASYRTVPYCATCQLWNAPTQPLVPPLRSTSQKSWRQRLLVLGARTDSWPGLGLLLSLLVLPPGLAKRYFLGKGSAPFPLLAEKPPHFLTHSFPPFSFSPTLYTYRVFLLYNCVIFLVCSLLFSFDLQAFRQLQIKYSWHHVGKSYPFYYGHLACACF